LFEFKDFLGEKGATKQSNTN